MFISLRVLVVGLSLILLSSCGGSSGSGDASSSNSSITAASSDDIYPNLEQDYLLSDEQMKTPSLSYPVSASSDYTVWVDEQHNKIRSITYDQDFSDLDFLRDELVSKRIVQLGESSHGTKEFNHIKVRLIKFLHQNLDFDFIAFESSLLGCYLQNEEITTQAADLTARGCIFGVWHTREVLELFEYIKETHNTSRPLRLIGFDVQFSSYLGDTLEKYLAFIKPVVHSYDSTYYDFVADTMERFFKAEDMYYDCSSGNQSQCQVLSGLSADLEDRLQQLSVYFASYTGVNDSNPELSEASKITEIAIESMLYYLAYMVSVVDTNSFGIQRDKGMASNLTELATTVFPDKKFIVWAHNAHIKHETKPYSIDGVPVPMGSYLKDSWGDELYTIGIFMLRGLTNNNNKDQIAVDPVENNSLEALFYSLRTAAAFIPFNQTNEEGLGDDWQFNEIEVKFWGDSEDSIVPSETYHAVIFIDHSTPSEYMY